VYGIAEQTQRATDPAVKGLDQHEAKVEAGEVGDAAGVALAEDAVEERAWTAAGEEEGGEEGGFGVSVVLVAVVVVAMCMCMRRGVSMASIVRVRVVVRMGVRV
jgi:hypothetical protein